MILLRFRDITIPDGETIERHSLISENHDYVWWGWMMRQHEIFPEKFLLELSLDLVQSSQSVLLVHTGFRRLYSANLLGVSTYPDGQKISSPERTFTPKYMHESKCAAWFKLASFSELRHPSISKISGFPTLPDLSIPDQSLLEDNNIPLSKFLTSEATIWEVEK